MIIYWSMILWIAIIYFVYSANHKEEVMLADYNIHQGIQKNIPLVYAIVTFGYIIFWVGMRKYIADTTSYIGQFEAISTDFSTAWSEINWEESKSPGFDAFNVLFKCFISDDYQWWLMTIAVISGGCIMIVLRKYSVDFFFSSFLFITLLTFYGMINIMRQFICIAILFLLCTWIKDGKFIKFILAVLLLSTVHLTALMMIPIYFVARSKPWKIRIAIFVLGIIFICIFAEPFFAGVDNALSDTVYSGYTNQFSGDDGTNPLKIFLYVIPPALAFVFRNKLEPYYKKYPILPICINMSLVTASLYFISMFTSGILIGRLPMFVAPYNLILIPFLLRLCISKEERSIVQSAIICVMILYFELLMPHFYHSEITGGVLDFATFVKY